MEPTVEQLQDVARRLQAGLNPDPRVQGELVEWLQTHSNNAVFNKCLLAVGAAAQGVDTRARSLALMQLKENTKKYYKEAVEPIVTDMKQGLISILGSPSDKAILKAASTCISTLIRTQGLAIWPDIFTHLWPLTSNPAHAPGIIRCVKEIAEDNAAQIDTGDQGRVVCGNLLNFIGSNYSSQDQGTIEALRAVGYMLESDSLVSPSSGIDKFVTESLPQILQLLHAATSAHPMYLPEAVRIYRLLLSYYNELIRIEPGFSEILPVVFKAAQSSDENLAMEACEYWNEFCSIRTLVKKIASTQGTLGDLLNVLMGKMLYSELEIAMMDEADEKDDIKPCSMSRFGDNSDDIEDVDQWTPRKAAASAVDHLSAVLREAVISPMGHPQNWLLSEIDTRLKSPEWRVQECGVLLLGALSEGSYEAFLPLLPVMIPQLFALAENTSTHYLVSSITCWSLSRYEHFICSHPDTSIFTRYVKLLLQCMGMPKRRLQEMAVSSFAGLMEHNIRKVISEGLVVPIIEKLSELVTPGRYTTRNLVILLDAISALVMGAREEMNTQKAHELVFKPVIEMLRSTREDSPVLPRLLLTVRYMCQGLGPSFTQYLPSTYAFLQGLVGNYYEMLFSGPNASPEWNHTQFAFVFLCTLVHELPEQTKALITTQAKGATMLDMAVLPIVKPELNVERPVIGSSFEFLAECVRQFPDVAASLVLHLERILGFTSVDDPVAIAAMDLLREVLFAMKMCGVDTRHVVAVVSRRLAGLMLERQFHSQALQSAAMCLGVCGLAAPDSVGDVNSFIEGLGWHISREREGRLKELAFQGFLEILNTHFSLCSSPQPIVAFGTAVAGLHTRPGSIVPGIVAFLARLKEFTGHQWPSVVNLLPPAFPVDIMSKVDPTRAAPPPPPPPPPR